MNKLKIIAKTMDLHAPKNDGQPSAKPKKRRKDALVDDDDKIKTERDDELDQEEAQSIRKSKDKDRGRA